MDLPTRAFDSFRVEEAYNWHDDVMRAIALAPTIIEAEGGE